MAIEQYRCPVCGASGYKSLRREHRGGDILATCRNGHPHYIPDSLWSCKPSLKSEPRAAHLDGRPLPAMTIRDEAAIRTARAMRYKLDEAALEVLRAGDSWGEGPYEFPGPGFDELQSLAEPLHYSVTCNGGAVPHGWVPPDGWRMVRHADWVAEGKPGETQFTDVERYRK